MANKPLRQETRCLEPERHAIMTPDDNSPEQKLIKAAQAAKKHSYSPYSHFAVGAAVMLEDGRIFTGTNIENASYGLSCCAERVALFSARTASTAKITGLAISIGGEDLAQDFRVPCGACRQVMAEFMTAETPVYIDANRTFTIDELLPHAFKLI